MAEILATVRERRGVDSREHRPAAVARRIHDRRVAAGVQTMADYLDRLRREATEADRPIIYFAPALQARVLARLCDALAPGGLLRLGEAEWPSGGAAERLRFVDRKARVFALATGEGRS